MPFLFGDLFVFHGLFSILPLFCRSFLRRKAPLFTTNLPHLDTPVNGGFFAAEKRSAVIDREKYLWYNS